MFKNYHFHTHIYIIFSYSYTSVARKFDWGRGPK